MLRFTVDLSDRTANQSRARPPSTYGPVHSLVLLALLEHIITEDSAGESFNKAIDGTDMSKRAKRAPDVLGMLS